MQTRGVTRKLRRLSTVGTTSNRRKTAGSFGNRFQNGTGYESDAVVQDGFTLSPRDPGKCCLIRRCVTYTKLALVVENRSARNVVSVTYPAGRTFKLTPPPC